VSSSHIFPTLREDDPESGLMHFRARSYDPRLGRFIQKDPLSEERLRRTYTYGLNNPVSAKDPSGAKSEVLTIGNSWVIVSFVAFYSDLGIGDNAETRTAYRNARRLNAAVHQRWNEWGRGWRVYAKINGNIEERNLYFVPWVYAVSEEIVNDAALREYDKIFVHDKANANDSAISARPHTPSNLARFPGSTIPSPTSPAEWRLGQVPYQYFEAKTGRFDVTDSNRSFAHEYGHLLGLAERYDYAGTKPADSPGWAGSIMGVSGRSASMQDIQELGRTTLGVDVVAAAPNSRTLFSGPFTPGFVDKAGFTLIGGTSGLSAQAEPNGVAGRIRGWPEWQSAPR